MMKTGRILSILLCAVLGMSHVQAFSDVSSSHPYADGIHYLEVEGIVEGYADGTFRPNATINRAEFVKIIAATVEDPAVIERCSQVTQLPFQDTIARAWYIPYVCAAMSHGEGSPIKGYPDGTFRPEQPISFAEASKVLYTYLMGTASARGQAQAEFDVQTPYTDWYAMPVSYFEKYKAIPVSISTLTQPITRAEMAEMMYRIMDKVQTSPSMTLDELMGVEVPQLDVESDEEVIHALYALLSDTPESAYTLLDKNALSQKFQAGHDDMAYTVLYNVTYNSQAGVVSYDEMVIKKDGSRVLRGIVAQILANNRVSLQEVRVLDSAELQTMNIGDYTARIIYAAGGVLKLQVCVNEECTDIASISPSDDLVYAEFGNVRPSPQGRFLRFDTVFAEGSQTKVFDINKNAVVYASTMVETVKGFTDDERYYYACTPTGLFPGYVAIYSTETFERMQYVDDGLGHITSCTGYDGQENMFSYQQEIKGETVFRSIMFDKE